MDRSLESFDSQPGEPVEIAILGEQNANAGLSAQRRDLRIEHETPNGVRLLDRFRQEGDELLARRQESEARTCEDSIEGGGGFTRGERRIE